MNERLHGVAECDERLRDLRAERGSLVRDLDRQRTSIASLKTRERKALRAKVGAGAPIPQPMVAVAEVGVAAELARFESELQSAAPRIERLGDEIREIERRRRDLLAGLTPVLRYAYDTRAIDGAPPAIAHVACGVCEECHVELPTIMPGGAPPSVCPSCQRLLCRAAGPEVH